jgi:signal transduction histidine kinase
VAGLTRLVFDLRIVAVCLTIVSLPSRHGGLGWLIAALLGGAVISLVPLFLWQQVGPLLMGHPAFLTVDLVFAFIVLAVAGPESPFLYFTLGTSVLSGVLYGWRGATLFSVLLMAGYGWVLALRAPVVGTPHGFHLIIGIPALYPITAAAGVAVRRLLDRQAAAQSALAAGEERSRLSRELHDSLAKTLHGISLTASALPGWVDRDPDAARAEARVLARAAQTAANEARELLVDLRSDRLDLPLHEAIARWTTDWAKASGITTHTEISEVQGVSPATRYELFCVLKEALRNVERHAAADWVHVDLRLQAATVTLMIVDDGVGLSTLDREAKERAGHFGLIGMSERLQRVGGDVDLTATPGGGVTLTARAPIAAPERRAAPQGASH